MSKYEQLVDTSTRGLACLCFRNKDKLSMAEISEIFSEHGNVVSVNRAGTETGHRFVRFKTKEEALKCAIALDGNPSIQLQPVKPKSKDSNEQHNHTEQFTRKKSENINEQKTDQTPLNAKQTERAESTKSSQSSRKSIKNNNQRHNRDENGLGTTNNTNNVNTEISRENLNTQRTATNNQHSARQYTNSRPGRNFHRANEADDNRNEIQNPRNYMNAAKLEQLHKLRGTIANSFQPSSNNFTFNTSGLPTAAVIPSAMISSSPSSHYSSRGQSVMTDMPPPLVPSLPSLPFGRDNVTDKEIEVFLACDVIVANIHSNIGVSNIYQMFRKFGPIHVSDIETVSEINVRFCYVYFETPNDALEVEQSFDGVSVCGQNLITLRPQRLEAEAGIF